MDKSSTFKDQQLYGRRTWNLLHSMAAYFPEEPSKEEQGAAIDFVEGLMDFGIDYPEWGQKFL